MHPRFAIRFLRARRVAVGALVVALLCGQVLTASAQSTIYLPDVGGGHLGAPAEPGTEPGVNDAAEPPQQAVDGNDEADETTAAAGPVSAEAFSAPTWTVQYNLGVGTQTPVDRIEVRHSANSVARLGIYNSSTGASASSNLYLQTGSKAVNLAQYGPGVTSLWDGVSLANRARLRSDAATTALVLTTGGNAPLIFGTNDDERMRITPGGNVIIGNITPTPVHKLSVIGGPTWTSNGWTGSIELANASAIGWQKNAYGNSFGMGQTTDGFLIFHTGANPGTTGSSAVYDMFIGNDGLVGIGTTNPIAKLHVLGAARVDGDFLTVGTIRAYGGDIRVTNGSFIDDGVTLTVPDYVFEPEYPLMSLAEVRAYVEREKHLPNVPSEEEIKASGLDLGAFHMRLLEKVEELTLYTLAQDEQLQSQEQELTEQGQEVEELRQMVDLLRQQNQALETRLAALEGQE